MLQGITGFLLAGGVNFGRSTISSFPNLIDQPIFKGSFDACKPRSLYDILVNMKRASKSRKILITGGTGSVGMALVEAFTSIAHCVSFQFNHDELAAKKLAKEFGAMPIPLDFGKHSVLPEVNFDVLVNNAGINISDAYSHQVTDQDWNLTLQVNLTAPFGLVR